ncbi:hypothetical protein EJ04DRAFT_508275 [Polyplosphaeria fusca]|uniref:Small ribosomal subunit protein mS38 n=1 Tax=Polyplosphaeria fusca TaxID=682080 RepID=A0A9P4V6Y0_9PLEO|nr:hypothetical protein EJ04DRAFT_508275 [Polyplosphaeria fusca]
MFSPALGRAVRSTSSIPAPVCTLARPAATLNAAQQTFTRRPHQRRLSSSKASIPPDGSNGSNSAQQTPATGTTKAPTRTLKGKAARKRAAAPPPLPKVPHVPPTDYLQKPEVKISSFFSLHRPMSVTSAIPPVSSPASFESIFHGRAPNERQTMANNIQTLSSGINQLEAALRGHELKQAEETLHTEGQVQHLDGPPQASVDQLMAKFVPFRPPPPPVPLDEAGQPETMTGRPAEESAAAAAPVPQRAWSTEVVVTESMDASGKRTYSATTAPMVEIDVSPAPDSDQVEIRQPFLERMRQRQNAHNRYRESHVRADMQLISVKRQRKLKMKKHKYKKLMKRTRLLRRKLDRT